MKLKSVVLGVVVSCILLSCVQKSDNEKLQLENKNLRAELEKYQLENKSLKAELEEYQFGADRLVAIIEKAYSEKDYKKARESITLLSNKHPESPKNEKFIPLLKKINEEELIAQKKKDEEMRIAKEKKEKEEKERIRLANLNNTGMWSIEHYVDEFGEKTKEAYIRNRELIIGTFSNTATQNSSLNVTFLISNSTDISIQLYEYSNNNPVKAYKTDSYKVLIQDKDGKRYQLIAKNYSDRLCFDKTDSKQVHNILIKGGSIKFKIYEVETPTTEYDFTISKADWYDNAFQKLKEAKK